MRRALCFLTVEPSTILLDFLHSLNTQNEYDLFLCIDKHNYRIPEKYARQETVYYIQYTDKRPEHAGFLGSVMYVPDRACSRDKALFYFWKDDTAYEHMWFIEDDVYLASCIPLLAMDKTHPIEDLLCSSFSIVTENPHKWHWDRLVAGKIELPWANSMICAIRISRALLNEISMYAQQNGRLLFDEALFTTLALHARLKYACPVALKNITFKNTWEDSSIDNHCLYHPIKDVERQRRLRMRECDKP